MPDQPLGVAILGCGNIAGPYAENLAAYPELKLTGFADPLVDRAQALVAKHGGRAHGSLEELLADDRVELVVNLTLQRLHGEMTARCLEAGRHVFSEKPLAMTHAEARALVDLAQKKNRRLGCSPFTYMGEAQQTAWKIIREGRLGAVRVIFAEVNWGRIEDWHPAPGPFYEVGALYDVAVYPLTMVTAFFGPARRAWAWGRVVHPDRVTREGVKFHIDTPDFAVAMIELESGPVVRLTSDFYVARQCSKQDGLEVHGDAGTLYLQTWHDFDSAVEFAKYHEALQPVPYLRPPYQGSRRVEWGRGVRDMVQAIAARRPHRASGAQGTVLHRPALSRHRAVPRRSQARRRARRRTLRAGGWRESFGPGRGRQQRTGACPAHRQRADRRPAPRCRTKD